MERLRVARAAWSALAFLLALGLVLVPAPAAPAAVRQETSADRLLLDAAGWHGRAIAQPHGHEAVRTSSASTPPGWSAGAVSLGTGLTRADGSRRVREVQRRLRRLGYAPGRVDGIYGPRTRAAVGWFQRKHGLPPDGRASLATVRHLRERTGAIPEERLPAAGTGDAPAPAAPAETSAGSRTAPVPPAPRILAAPGTEDDGIPVMAAGALLLAGVVLLALGYAVEQRRRRRHAAMRPQGAPVAYRPVAAPAPRRPRAVGYVRLAPGAASASFHAQAAAIETGCLARGMALVSLVSDVEPDRGAAGRPPALAFALERLESGEADRLVVSRLDHVASTAGELRPLLERLAGRAAGLVVLDRDVDTAALPAPAAADALLRRPAERRQARFVPRARRTIDAHIASMLEEGSSPEQIVDALNAEPVPPPQGGEWEFGGVQAALRRRGGQAGTWEERSDV